ncbi:phosphatase PAP2 family protein [Saccharicrinis sp. FJH62]|uniref:phosphatase PAP2 family protein n=1 Tax=Saccharicrinis sp. FJH62 TaxID=3344657 RepID=UPI0035D4FCA1
MTRGILAIVLLWFSVNVLSEDPTRNDTTVNVKADVCLNNSLSFRLNDLHSPLNIYRKSLSDLGQIFASPFQWNKSQFLKAGVILATGVTIYKLDEPIYTFINRNKTPFTEFTSKYFLEPQGNYATFALLAGMAGYGLAFHKEKPVTTAVLAAESYLITGVFTLIPKTLAGRVRPYHTDPLNPNVWNGPFGGRSFWSGHTATVFGVASVIAEMYKDHKAIPIIAYTSATLTGLSRIHDGKHWPSDVFFGAVVGTVIGKMIVKSYQSANLSFIPVFTPQSQGFHLAYTF